MSRPPETEACSEAGGKLTHKRNEVERTYPTCEQKHAHTSFIFDPDVPLTETILERNEAPRPVFEPMRRMVVEPGTREDWFLLHHLHYKSETMPMGPRFFRMTLDGETISVLILSPPRGMVRERHMVFPNLKPGSDSRLMNSMRYHFWNENLTVISRFVTDTMFRGIGLGYRMMNLVSRMSRKNYVEIQSSMSRYNTFGQKAGFRFVKPQNARLHDEGVKFFRKFFNALPQDTEGLIMEYNSFSEKMQKRIHSELVHFYRTYSSLENTGTRAEGVETRIPSMPASKLIRAIQQMCLAAPMYGIYKNPDAKNEIPSRIPLLAFDLQKPSEPLKWKPEMGFELDV